MNATMRGAFVARTKQSWLSAGLIIWLIVVLVQSTAEAKWLRDPEPMLYLVTLGVVFGALLAESRFRPRTVFLIDLVVSLSIVLIIVGRVVPTLSFMTTTPFADSLWLMNVRLMTLLDQLQRDLASIIAGHFPGTQLITVVFGLLAWNASIWLVWSVVRRRSSFGGIVPCAIVLALNAALSGHEPTLPLFFVIGAVLLIGRTAYTSKLHHWDQHRIGYPELISEDWLVQAVLIAIVVVFAAGLSTPEWRDSFQRFIKSLQPPPESASSTTPIVVQPNPVASFTTSFVPDLQSVGEPLPQSDDTIFYVTTDDPPAGVDSSGLALPPKRQHYWRGAIFDRYTGLGWEPIVVGDDVRRVDAPESPPPGRYALKQDFEIVSLRDNRLFATNDPVSGGEGTSVHIAPADPTVSLLRGTSPKYEVTSWAADVSTSQLQADSIDYPAAIRDRYLQLTVELPQRVRDLAARITLGAGSPYDKALRLQEYLRATYPYRLDVPLPPSGRDVVDYFLFDAPGGFCSYYASAMAVMLRTQGVPARVVTGFATGDYDGLTRQFRVPADAAHAWVEVYFPSYGWIEFEPTASRSVFDYQTAGTKQSEQSSVAISAGTRTSIEQAIGLGVMIVIGLALTIVIAIQVRRRIVQARLAPDRLARDLYWSTRRSLAGSGLIAVRSITPDEFLSIYAPQWDRWPRLREAMQSVSVMYIRAVFTANEPSREEVNASRRVWQAAWRERWQLRWREIGRRLRR